MISLKEADEIIRNTYIEADLIYSLARKKASWNRLEKVIEVAVFFLTPFVNAVNTVNGLSDLGIYYLVEEKDKQLLVRIDKADREKVEKKDITGKFDGEYYIYGNDKFEKVRLIKNGKKI